MVEIVKASAPLKKAVSGAGESTGVILYGSVFYRL